MEARPCQITEFFNGTKQLLVPLFQRSYEWRKEHWQTLWEDLIDRYERTETDAATHFTGAIVTAPAKSVPVGVSKHLIIDGQQRLTTVALLVCALRSFLPKDAPKYRKLTRLLLNEDDEGTDHFKLLPTQLDREAFIALLKDAAPLDSRMTEAFHFFRSQIQGSDSEGQPLDVDRIIETLQTQITVVSINLADTDDPYLIFESLNAKGAPLTQADLIRNYLLLRLHSQAQQDAYERFWIPMQRLLPSDHLTDFMRQYLMQTGEEVAKSEIYGVLKKRLYSLADGAILGELERMHSAAELYARIVGLLDDPDPQVRAGLARLRRWEVSVATPLILRFLIARKQNAVTVSDVHEALYTIESFVVRRTICRVPTNQMKRIFLSLTKDLSKDKPIQDLKRILAGGTKGRSWPKDEEFQENWVTYRAYASPVDRCKMILETIEGALGHKEPASFSKATIEHVLPQTLSAEWQTALGPDAEVIHEKWVDTFGNLTLSGYNSELSNEAFAKKKELLLDSHFEMNKRIAAADDWNEATIRERALELFEEARRLWGRASGQEEAG